MVSIMPRSPSLRRHVRWIVCALGFAPLVVGTTPSAAQERRPIEIDDLFRLRSVSSPVLSPDGNWVAYTIGVTDEKAGERETRIWMTALDGSATLAMTALGTSASSPAFSPDGRYLSFLASRGEKAQRQVWVLDRRGGEAQALTDVEQGVSDYAWSPDGTRLVLTIRDKEAKDSVWEKTAPPWVIDRLQFKRDGTGYLTGNRRTHLFVFDVASKALWPVTWGTSDETSPVWSPDGKMIAFVSNRTAEPDRNDNTDIWVVSADRRADGGDSVSSAPPELLQITTNPGADRAPAWSPDGRSIAYVTTLDPDLIWYATNHLAVITDGGEPRVLTQALDRNVGTPRFTPDGRGIWFELEDSAEDHLARIELRNGRITRPVSGPVSVDDYAVSPAGDVVVLLQRLDCAAELYRVDGGNLRALTGVNDSLFGALRLAAVQDETFQSADGTEVEGFFYLPPDYQAGTRYPTLLRIHGGPVSQFSHGFNFEAQLLAAHGYVVVTVNPRGSSGYGQAFSHAIWADWGNKDFADVMAGVDHAIDRGWTDPERLGVGGWSYGGILTDYVLTKTDRFQGAISGASEVLYVANYGHDHYQREWEAELGLPWESRETWERLSPFNAVDKIVTPTLIMGGEKDWNVPILNSEQLYEVLRRRGVPTELVVYPGQPHGIRVPAYQRDRLERYLAWYDRWVRGTSPSR